MAKESVRASGTHPLESVEGRTSQDSGITGRSEGHSRTGECRERDKSGQRKNACDVGYSLPGECRGQEIQDSERKRASVGHSLSGQCRGCDKPEQRKKASKRGHSRTGECRGWDMSGRKASERGILTL